MALASDEPQDNTELGLNVLQDDWAKSHGIPMIITVWIDPDGNVRVSSGFESSIIARIAFNEVVDQIGELVSRRVNGEGFVIRAWTRS